MWRLLRLCSLRTKEVSARGVSAWSECVGGGSSLAGSGGDGAAEGDDLEGGEAAKGQSQATTASDVAVSGSTWAAELKGLSEFLANDFKTFRAELEESSLSLLEFGAARMAWSAGPTSGSALLLAAMEEQWHDIDTLQV